MIIKKFRGEIPRLHAWNRDASVATTAVNTNFHRGTLRSWRSPQDLATVDGAKSFYIQGCTVVPFAECTRVVPYSKATNEIVYLTDGKSPRIAQVKPDGSLEDDRPLGLPVPVMGLSISATEARGKHTTTRRYVYTYVNKYGEESMPSLPSNSVTVAHGTVVRIYIPDHDGVEGVTAVNIYRTATADREGDGGLDLATGYLLVDQVPLTLRNFEDRVDGDALGRALDTLLDAPPLEGMSAITKVRGTPVLAGAIGNKVYFSSPYKPHAWPFQHEITLPHNVTALHSDGKWVYAIMNTGVALIEGAEPCDRAPRQVVIHATAPPPAACGARGSVITPHGVAYLSVDGLALVAVSGELVILTAGTYTPDQWRELRPDACVLGYYKNKYFVTSELGTIVVTAGEGDTMDESASISRIPDLKATEYLTTNTGELTYLQDGRVRAWDKGDFMEAVWHLTLPIYPGGITAAVARLGDATEATLEVRSSYGDVAKAKLLGDVPTRIKRLPRAPRYELYLRVKGEVLTLGIGSTISDATKE